MARSQRYGKQTIQDAFQSFILGQAEYFPMEPVVDLKVRRKCFDRGFTDGVQFFLTTSESIEFAFVHQTLGREPRSAALEESANFDAVPHVIERELSHDKSAGGVGFEQSFVGEPL